MQAVLGQASARGKTWAHLSHHLVGAARLQADDVGNHVLDVGNHAFSVRRHVVTIEKA